MAKVTLDVDEKNVTIIKHILENLKDGLINNMEISQRRYTPKNKPLEDDFIQKKSASQGKYISPEQYRKKINQ